MRTTISPSNPHHHSRYGFAWEKIPAGGAAHLDFGCGDGAFLNSLRSKKIGRLVGVDISRNAVEEAAARFPDIDVRRIPRATPLPFENGEFSSVSLLDVVEHIFEQAALLKEVRRALAEDGTLVVTVPGKHLFSFLDMGNLKFRFPELHRWYYCRTHSVEEYDRRYVSNPEGLVGDVSAKKRWHEHFSRAGLERLLGESGFRMMGFDGAGLFARPISVVGRVLGRIRLLRPLLRRVTLWDARRFSSTHLFCVVRKAHVSQRDAGQA